MVRISARARDIWEIAVGYGLILAVIWTPNPVQRALYWVALVTIFTITLLRRDDLNALGLGWRGLAPSLWIVPAALVVSVVAAGAAFGFRTLHPLFGHASLGFHIWGYAVWALMQEFLLQSYFFTRFLRLTSRRWQAIAPAVLLFAVAHLPNPLLVGLTLVWAALSCVLFLRYRNIYALGIAHGILGLCVAVTVPNHIHHHMRVGLGYLRYHQPAHPRRYL